MSKPLEELTVYLWLSHQTVVGQHSRVGPWLLPPTLIPLYTFYRDPEKQRGGALGSHTACDQRPPAHMGQLEVPGAGAELCSPLHPGCVSCVDRGAKNSTQQAASFTRHSRAAQSDPVCSYSDLFVSSGPLDR